MKMFLITVVCSLFFALSADESEATLYNFIEIRQKLPRNNKITGKLPPDNVVHVLTFRFKKAIRKLPIEFVKKSGIRYVTFLTDLRLKRIPAAGLAHVDTIYLSTQHFSPKTIYHEIFHIFDSQSQNQEWCRLNAHKFVYTGSKFYEEDLSKREIKRKNNNLSTGKYTNDFVSRYAMSNEREDRAETFAYMVYEGSKFHLRTRNSYILRRKKEYIIKMTSQKKLISKKFWYNKILAR